MLRAVQLKLSEPTEECLLTVSVVHGAITGGERYTITSVLLTPPTGAYAVRKGMKRFLQNKLNAIGDTHVKEGKLGPPG